MLDVGVLVHVFVESTQTTVSRPVDVHHLNELAQDHALLRDRSLRVHFVPTRMLKQGTGHPRPSIAVWYREHPTHWSGTPSPVHEHCVAPRARNSMFGPRSLYYNSCYRGDIIYKGTLFTMRPDVSPAATLPRAPMLLVRGRTDVGSIAVENLAQQFAHLSSSCVDTSAGWY